MSRLPKISDTVTMMYYYYPEKGKMMDRQTLNQIYERSPELIQEFITKLRTNKIKKIKSKLH